MSLEDLLLTVVLIGFVVWLIGVLILGGLVSIGEHSVTGRWWPSPDEGDDLGNFAGVSVWPLVVSLEILRWLRPRLMGRNGEAS